jgi:hypothetical protein
MLQTGSPPRRAVLRRPSSALQSCAPPSSCAARRLSSVGTAPDATGAGGTTRTYAERASNESSVVRHSQAHLISECQRAVPPAAIRSHPSSHDRRRFLGERWPKGCPQLGRAVKSKEWRPPRAGRRNGNRRPSASASRAGGLPAERGRAGAGTYAPIQRQASCSGDGRSTSRPLPTPSSVARGRSANRMCGWPGLPRRLPA